MANIDKKPLDENGNEHGEWVYYYNNGQLWYRGNFIHGVLHGFCEGYYEDGRLEYRGNWNMGVKRGYWYFSYKPKRYHLWLI